MPQGQVIVHVERKAGAQPCCPTCSKPAPGYDSRRRRWRHLDTCQYKTILEADVPRVKCPEHGVVTTTVPWAEPNSGFTALFEALVIDWLKEASTSAVARLMGLSWNAIDGIMQRAVKRGLANGENYNDLERRFGVSETPGKRYWRLLDIIARKKTCDALDRENPHRNILGWTNSRRGHPGQAPRLCQHRIRPGQRNRSVCGQGPQESGSKAVVRSAAPILPGGH